jgi:hypothetical protein
MVQLHDVRVLDLLHDIHLPTDELLQFLGVLYMLRIYYFRDVPSLESS